MPTTGAYEFKRASLSVDGCVPTDRLERIETGTWAWVKVEDYGWILYFGCPDCGHFGCLWDKNRGHNIDPAGNVSPSVSHSWQHEGVERCGFHTQPTKLVDFVDKRGV